MSVELDPRSRPFGPRGGALALQYCRDDEVLIEGPAGTGKTRAVLEKVNLALMKYPGARTLAVRKTRVSMTDSVLVTFENKVLPEGNGISTGRPARAQRFSYTYPNGSELVIGGMDKSSKIMSTEYDIIAVFEATELTEGDWEDLSTRLRNGVIPYQQLIGDCNPSVPSHWLNQRCLSGRTRRLKSRHADNPSVTDTYLAKLAALTGARRARLYEGKWVAQEGLVYDGFRDPGNVVDAMPPGWESWPRFRSIDFGFTNPFVCQWWAQDPDGRLWMYREIYFTGRLVSAHAKQIKRLSRGERIVDTVADHDAEDRATLEAAGIVTKPARKSIMRGIEAVKERVAPAGDGRPRIFFLRDALVEADPELQESKRPWSTLQEFDGYHYPKDASGKPRKELPVEVDDHGMDATRYMVAHFDLGPGGPRIRTLQ